MENYENNNLEILEDEDLDEEEVETEDEGFDYVGAAQLGLEAVGAGTILYALYRLVRWLITWFKGLRSKKVDKEETSTAEAAKEEPSETQESETKEPETKNSEKPKKKSKKSKK